jgi:Ca2+-transporting ATPase
MSVVETPQAVTDLAALACEIDAFDPMEKAILEAASEEVHGRRRGWTLERDYPFSDAFLAVCHVWREPSGARRVAIKGAPETVLALCGQDVLMGEVGALSSKGRRVLAVAEADWADEPLADPRGYPFRFAGFLQLADPLRASVPEAVAQCRRAGIRVVMITGDYPGTARHIAGEAGIPSRAVLSGDDLQKLSDEKLIEVVREASVFARVRPEQKLRLVQAYRAAGEVVAMTGDGVNDAPALKAAHIGIAMGRRGTDVAREAAALVLLDDDFGSIVRTVRLGRRIYENIRNAMRYLVSVHVPIAGMSFVPVALGGPLFLFPVHVVFLEFVIDPACTLVFEAERTEAGTMERPPRPPRQRLFDLRMLAASLALGAAMLAGVAAAWLWATHAGRDEGTVRAIGFAAIVVGNLALLHSMRSRRRTALEVLGEPNRALWWIGTGALGALAAALYLPPVAALFRFAPPGPADLAVAAAAGLAGVALAEAWKLVRRRAPG